MKLLYRKIGRLSIRLRGIDPPSGDGEGVTALPRSGEWAGGSGMDRIVPPWLEPSERLRSQAPFAANFPSGRFAPVHASHEQSVATPQAQQKKRAKTEQNYNSISCVFSISLAHSTAAWNFSVSRTELNHAHLSFVKRSQIVEM